VLQHVIFVKNGSTGFVRRSRKESVRAALFWEKASVVFSEKKGDTHFDFTVYFSRFAANNVAAK
jgi:hypothetical protein